MATVDLAAVRQRKRDIVESFRGGERRIRSTEGIDLLDGEVRFGGPRSVSVRLAVGEERDLTADLIVINTAARTAIPDLPGIDAVPAHLLVLGGGYVGLEFGQMFRRFGSRVTVVQRGPRLLAREDADIADVVAVILREDGVEVLLETATRHVAPAADGAIELTVQGPDGERTLAGSHLLVAAGREPNTAALDLPAAGVQTLGRGFIRVNEGLETNVPDVYAVGNVTGGPAFTHIAYDDFRMLRTNLLEGGAAATTGRLVPCIVYIDPQFGRIGLGEGEARRQGCAIRVTWMPMAYVARTLDVDEPRGLMKAVVDAVSGRILGFTCPGIEGGESMSMLQLVMQGKPPTPSCATPSSPTRRSPSR